MGGEGGEAVLFCYGNPGVGKKFIINTDNSPEREANLRQQTSVPNRPVRTAGPWRPSSILIAGL